MGNLTYSYGALPVSEQDAQKVATYNATDQILDAAINGRLAISTTGGTTTLTGTPAAPQAQNLFLDVSGTLASNGIIEIPVAAGTGRNRLYVVKNGTTGAFSLTVRKVGGTGVTVTQGYTAVLLYNDSDIVKLYETSHSAGVSNPRTDVSHSAGNFTGSGSMTWTVASGDQAAFWYTLIGKTLFVTFAIVTSTVGGTPDTVLQIAIPFPTGYTAAAARTDTPFLYSNDNGATHSTGLCSVLATGTVIRLFKAGFATWANTTDATSVHGTIMIAL